MAIHRPDRVLLHHIPLKFVKNRVSGGGRRAVDASIALVPFIDFLITLVVFLLQSFSASPAFTPPAGILMPNAANAVELESAPIVIIDSRTVSLDVRGDGGRRVDDVETLKQNPGVQRIEAMIQDLEVAKRNWPLLHPREPFTGAIVLQCDRSVDFRVIKKVLFSAAQAGYANVSFAVNHTGGD